VRAGGDGVCQFTDANGRHAVILIDDGDAQMLDVPAECIAEDDQLCEREDHRHDDQHRTPAEAPQLAFDDGPGACHD
jgi:hypothetical protein